jgi:hypothetical protein
MDRNGRSQPPDARLHGGMHLSYLVINVAPNDPRPKVA